MNERLRIFTDKGKTPLDLWAHAWVEATRIPGRSLSTLGFVCLELKDGTIVSPTECSFNYHGASADMEMSDFVGLAIGRLQPYIDRFVAGKALVPWPRRYTLKIVQEDGWLT